MIKRDEALYLYRTRKSDFQSPQKDIIYHQVLDYQVTGCLPVRVFKTKWFNKAARTHAISDRELCDAIDAALSGKTVDLGGGIYKKRLNHNRDRAIILARGGAHWFYAYLYAKQDMANISESELAAFRELARHYAALTTEKITALLAHKELVEICHDCKK